MLVDISGMSNISALAINCPPISDMYLLLALTLSDIHSIHDVRMIRMTVLVFLCVIHYESTQQV